MARAHLPGPHVDHHVVRVSHRHQELGAGGEGDASHAVLVTVQRRDLRPSFHVPHADGRSVSVLRGENRRRGGGFPLLVSPRRHPARPPALKSVPAIPAPSQIGWKNKTTPKSREGIIPVTPSRWRRDSQNWGVGDYKRVAPTSPVTMNFPSGEKANALRVFLEKIGFSLTTGLLRREKWSFVERRKEKYWELRKRRS